jgi:hypothetical protein
VGLGVEIPVAVQHSGEAVLVKRFVDEPPLAPNVEGYVIDQPWNPRARKIAQSDDDRPKRIAKINAEMANSSGRRSTHSG